MENGEWRMENEADAAVGAGFARPVQKKNKTKNSFMKAFKVKKYLISPSGEVYGYMNTNIVDVAEMIVLEHDWMDEYGYSDMLIIDFLVERKKFVHYTVYSQWCCHSKGLTGKQQRKMSKLSGGL